MEKQIRKNCKLRHENGNCLPHGGFCTSVSDNVCCALQQAYQSGKQDGFLACYGDRKVIQKEKEPIGVFVAGLDMDNKKALQVIEQNLIVAEHDFNNENDDYQKEQVKALTAAQRALKKQNAIYPDFVADGYDEDGVLIYDTAYCPICKCEFEYDTSDWGKKYCPDCGQALDWSACND